jgi:hypothetical protein
MLLTVAFRPASLGGIGLRYLNVEQGSFKISELSMNEILVTRTTRLCSGSDDEKPKPKEDVLSTDAWEEAYS